MIRIYSAENKYRYRHRILLYFLMECQKDRNKKKSAVLEGDTYFVEKVRANQRQGMNLEEAVDSAIKDPFILKKHCSI